ncbi:MAG: transposase [Saccharofermentanales bacterium]
MKRKDRNFYKGGIYHIMQRGNNKAFIFDDQHDKAVFIKIIKEKTILYPCYFLYYILMDNHYHFIIEMQDVEPSIIMREINRCYSKYFNKKYDRTGTIFGDRYKSQVVTDKRYFLKLLQYIAYNPVKAALIKHPSQYKWCAHKEMVSRKPVLIDKKRLLSHIGASYSCAYKTYLEMIDDKRSEITTVDDIKELIIERRNEELEALLNDTFGNEIIVQMIQNKTRIAKIENAKREFIKAAKAKGYKSTEIARLFDVSKRGVDYLSET